MVATDLLSGPKETAPPEPWGIVPAAAPVGRSQRDVTRSPAPARRVPSGLKSAYQIPVVVGSSGSSTP